MSNKNIDKEVADDGTANTGSFDKFKGENPYGAVYKVRETPLKNKPEYNDNLYSNYAQRQDEPDFPAGLSSSNTEKVGLSDLLDWSIPPTATAFSGFLSQPQVVGPSLFNLHRAKEREYFSNEGEDNDDDVELVLPRKQSAEFFLRDPGRSLPGETLIENSNFDQVKSLFSEGPSIKKSETNPVISNIRTDKNARKFNMKSVGKDGKIRHRFHRHRSRFSKHRKRNDRRHNKSSQKSTQHSIGQSQVIRFPDNTGQFILKKKKK